ncbi:MAG: histidine--tRNA ligase [Bacteroidetes bacterium]|nr:histidine--tRNA ligase [Bacteroidota bacterium]MBU1423611.1 histidine--tRNA ligase [Bacteroidota bacterium]MBU2636599.1 histidine--tRNA ligase [Bacteroidota bacterium]
MKFKSIKGTKDILPDESHLWQSVEQHIRSVMETYNYKEIRTSVFEETSLFARSIGELTDIVGKEMYSFIDRSGDSLTLKPEMTAAVIRSYIQHNLGKKQPLTKVYYLSPAFRQERPQAGRLRQFHQFGAEAIGGSNPEIDAEIISLSAAIYKKFGITEFEVRINSVGCQKCREEYKFILKSFLSAIANKLSTESQRKIDTNPMRVLDSKDENDKQLTIGAPLIKDYLCDECRIHFEKLQSLLQIAGVDYVVDGRIVRGLDYYTKTAYEIISNELGSQDALTGGGRYDLLVSELGGKPTPSVGFAAGMERLIMILKKRNKLNVTAPHPKLFIAAMDDKSRNRVFQEIFKLRNQGISCETDLLNRSLKAQMREADRQQADYVIVIGENEINSNRVSMKAMRTGIQQEISLDELPNYLTGN